MPTKILCFICEKLTDLKSISLIDDKYYICLSCLSKINSNVKIKLIDTIFGHKIYKELVKCAILNNLDISNVPEEILIEIEKEGNKHG